MSILKYIFYTQTSDGVERKHNLPEFTKWVQSKSMLEYFKEGKTIYLRKRIKNTSVDSIILYATVNDINDLISY